MYGSPTKKQQRDLYKSNIAQQQQMQQPGGHGQVASRMDQFNYSEHNRTSVKVHHAPGGGSNWSLGGGYGNDEPVKQKVSQHNSYNQQYENEYQPQQFGMKSEEMGTPDTNRQKQQSSYGQSQLKSQFWEESYSNSGNSQNRQTQSQNKSSRFGKEIQNQKNRGPMDQYNFGEYGNKRTSVKVHHAPGGKSNLNVFGDDSADVPMKFSAGGRSKAQSNAPVTEKEAYQVQWASQSDPQYDQNCYTSQVNKIKQDRPQFGFAHEENNSRKNKYNSFHESNDYHPKSYADSPVKQQWRQDAYYDDQQTGGYNGRQSSGNNSGPTSGVSSIKLLAPPGGHTTFSLY